MQKSEEKLENYHEDVLKLEPDNNANHLNVNNDETLKRNIRELLVANTLQCTQGNYPRLTHDNDGDKVNLPNQSIPSDSCYIQQIPSSIEEVDETCSTEINTATQPRYPKLLTKKVSIVSPSEVIEQQSNWKKMESIGRSLSTDEPDMVFDETTPLLNSCSSLPTVTSYETAQLDFPGPSTTQSEVGMKPSKRPRQRGATQRSLETQKMRPYIASPFMPIATPLSIPLERRAPNSPKPSKKNTILNGSAKPDEGLLAADELRIPTSNDEDSTSDEDDSQIPIKGSFTALSSKEWITMVMLALANLCSTVAFSCIAPFYPDEAKKKGMTESQTGIVFGVFELVMFVMAPIFGKYMTVIGSRNMFTLGLAITGITAILFGFLNYLPSGSIFFLASLLIRILEAIGDAAFVTSSFAISAKCFPGNIAVVVGVMETFAGLGYTAGPLIGGFLYEFGGFQVPFLVLGAILILATALGWWLIGNFKDDNIGTSKGMMAMLRIPVIWIMVYAVVVCAISLSFLDPTLSAHLQSFNLTPTMIGLMFLLCGGIYTLTAPLWGFLIDKYHCTTAVMVFGSSATVISMALIGPSPFLPLSKNLVMIGISLAVLGVAAGALYIPTFQSCLDAVKDHGYDDSFRTYGCVSGVFQSAFALGGFMGPTIGGFMVEKVGFAWTTTVIAAIHIMFLSAIVVFFSSCFKRLSH